MDVRLTDSQVQRIRTARSAAEIAEICAENEAEQAEHAEQAAAENPIVPRKPRYWSDADGFMHEYPD